MVYRGLCYSRSYVSSANSEICSWNHSETFDESTGSPNLVLQRKTHPSSYMNCKVLKLPLNISASEAFASAKYVFNPTKTYLM